MLPDPQIRCVVEAHSLNGESPTWDERTGRLWWVDIRAPALHAFDPASGEDKHWEMPAWVGCAVPCEDRVLVAMRTGLALFDPESGNLRNLAPAPFDSRRFIFNDGGCDPRGRLLVGMMYVPLSPGDEGGSEEGPVWRYEKTGKWSAVTADVKTSNGLCWSPDGRTMYHSGTEQHTIWAYDYDVETGEASRRREFAHVDVSDGGPDGACVDRDGFYWCAVFANGRLLRFDPDGKLERRVDLPIRYCSKPAFGGPGLDTLYVTSANWPLSPQERPSSQEGNLFALSPPVPGAPPLLGRRAEIAEPELTSSPAVDR